MGELGRPRRRRRAGIDLILGLGGGLLVLGQAHAQDLRAPEPTREGTLAAVAACGVPAAKVAITYDDELQSDVVNIGDLGGTGEARLRCVRRAVPPSFIVEVADPSQRSAYRESYAREAWARFKGQAVDRLKSRGMLDRVPRYDPRKGVAAFARDLEAVCGIRPGLALKATDSSGLMLRRSFLGNLMMSKTNEFDCLTWVSAASNADEYGIQLFFTGSVAPREVKR